MPCLFPVHIILCIVRVLHFFLNVIPPLYRSISLSLPLSLSLSLTHTHTHTHTHYTYTHRHTIHIHSHANLFSEEYHAPSLCIRSRHTLKSALNHILQKSFFFFFAAKTTKKLILFEIRNEDEAGKKHPRKQDN